MTDVRDTARLAETIFGAIERGRARHASDVHLEPGQGAALRVYTQVERLSGVAIEAEAIEAFLDATIDRRTRARLDKIGLADAVYDDRRTGAIRIHASRGKIGPRLAIRLLARSIPELESLKLPAVVERFCEWRSGFFLVCGPTGSGKSTTIASIFDRMNATAALHLVTFEDPIEYTHRWGQSLITQYEVGRDVATFADGVRGALRADPDVLFIGELRDAETAAAALQAAETGHLVCAAMHTPPETPQAVNRFIGLFPSEEQERARARLADALRAVLGLRLLPLRDGTGLRAATEILLATDAVKRIVRDGATHQLRSTIVAGRRDGMHTLESHLSELIESGDVEASVARAASSYPDDVRDTAGSRVR